MLGRFVNSETSHSTTFYDQSSLTPATLFICWSTSKNSRYTVLTFVVTLAVISQSTDPVIDAPQASRLLAATRADIRDVSFVFEGYYSGCIEGTPIEKVGPGRGPVYQGNYAIRCTTPEHFYAALLDRFVENRDAKPPSEEQDTIGILQGHMIRITRQPDEGVKFVSEAIGGPVSLAWPGSPERINYLWYFSTHTDLASRNYICQGWEDVDGHRCLRFQVDLIPEDTQHVSGHHVVRYWIDLERGGHPLRVEQRVNDGPNGLEFRAFGIKLKHLPLPDGRRVWFPVEGRVESFLSTAGLTRSPVCFETYAVLDGTVRFNQNIPDDVFSLKSRAKLPETEQMAKQRPRYELPPPRQDPVGIKERLDRVLVEADKQTKQLDASAPAADSWPWVPQAGLVAFGVLAIAGGAFWKWRSR